MIEENEAGVQSIVRRRLRRNLWLRDFFPADLAELAAADDRFHGRVHTEFMVLQLFFDAVQ